MTIVAFGGWAHSGDFCLPDLRPIALSAPAGGWTTIFVTLGGLRGTVVACQLLRSGRIRRSFADYDDYVKEDEPLAEYPHGRREMRHRTRLPASPFCSVDFSAGAWR